MSRRTYLAFLIGLGLSFASFLSHSQPYGNEWIDHSKTYFKLTLNADGVYRIPYSTLSQHFEDAVLVGDDFQLWGRGRQVPIYVTRNGQFNSSDYIEFYAEANDGELDKALYLPNENLNEEYSLYTETAAYFLTLDPGGDNHRLETRTNDPAGLPVEPYFWYRHKFSDVGTFHTGPPVAGGSLEVVRDSRYGAGEGYGGATFNGPGTRNRTLSTTNVYRGDPGLNAMLEHTHITEGFGDFHEISLTVGSSSFQYVIFSSTINKVSEIIPLSNVGNSTTTVSLQLTNGAGAAMADAFIALTYPRTFSFGNAANFRFPVANTAATQLQVTNFNSQSIAPVLYDLENGERYVAVVNGSRYDFGLLPVPQPRDLVMVSQGAANITEVSTLTPVNFIDYSAGINQGNNIIISHRSLKNSSDGTDYVTAYNDYRNSPEGGSHISQIAWITDLEDQFGWGVRNHPIAIRNFINFAVDNFSIYPDHVFIIGKGITYTSIRTNATNFQNCLIPSMGTPDSDTYLAARSPANEVPQVAIGRLSATNGDAVGQYLDKMMTYEGEQNDTVPFAQTVPNKQWNKRLLHLGGGKNALEQAQFKTFLNNYRTIAEDHFFGGKVHSVFKTSTDPIQISTSELVDSLITDGISLITFFGHSSTSTIDFDIQPEDFQNYGKFHVFLSNGCFVGSIFGTSAVTYSDRFIFQDNRGSIAYIAPITLAVPSSLNYYSDRFYRGFSRTMYRSSLGQIMQSTAEHLITTYGPLEDLLAKQMILHGDPALRINEQARPDYIITRNSISYDPNIVSASRDSFDVVIRVTNVGKAVDRDFTVGVQRTLPGGGLEDYQKIVHAPHFKDTVRITMPTDRVNGLGVNIFRIKVDFGEEIDETSEFNNEVVDTLVILSDDIKPVLPYDFCIQNAPPERIVFSTPGVSSVPREYILQIDTTEYFNSPLLVTQLITTTGGIVEWSPPVPWLENTVYYVRSALDSLIMGTYNWNGISFLYDSDLSTGWNQSHFFQFKKDDFFTLNLEEPDRQFKFSDEVRTLQLINGIHPNPLPPQQQETYLDGNLLVRNSLSKSSFNYFVFDVNTGKYLESLPDPDNPIIPCELGTWNSIHPCAFPDPRPVINFLVNDIFWRFLNVYFINSVIPDGAIVLVFTTQQSGGSFTMNIPAWESDTLFPGFDTSLFKAMETQLNATKIRDIQDFHPYVLCTQKGNPDFPTIEFHVDPNVVIDTTHTFEGIWNRGALRSVRIGPSNGWMRLELRWNSLDDPNNDVVSFNLSGIDTLQRRDILYEDFTDSMLLLDAVDHERYPHLQLEMNASDDSMRTAPQLKYWRVLYDKVPEAAVDPQLRYAISADSIEIGQRATIEVGLTNISDLDMDSMLVKVTLNRTGSSPFSFYKRFGPLPARESQILSFNLTEDILNATGTYTILVEANPDNDQPEQFHFNNYATFLLFIADDRINPIMDVTFDGIHILDGDIVSPRPEIIVKLKDENKGLAIDDTSSIEMYIYYPDAPETAVYVDPTSENVTFVPAEESDLAERNEAYLYFYPNFEVDGIYKLKVQGRDARDNEAGDYDYFVSFEVINESSISHFLNYPNPFSTSTRFVFTLTGAEIPDDVKIQIMTVSGRVVREITLAELGPINIGRNITDFAWDGTDRYGDPLANGLYIYKVFTKINGETIKQYKTSADKFFGKENFGKMYIVR